MSRQETQALIDRAKREVDLPGFLAEHGFVTVPEKDSRLHRVLAGPAGERVRMRKVRTTDEWVWEDLRAGSGGNIVHACQRLLHLTFGRTVAAIRKALASPPAAVPFSRGGRTSAVSTTPRQQRPPRTLPPLDEQGRRYLTETRRLDPATVDTFAPFLAENQGAVAALHNEAHDAEEKGEGTTRFTGSAEDGPGRGRGLWLAVADQERAPEQIIVADSFLDAMSAWESFAPELRSTVAVASTGGRPSAAGEDKLRRSLARMVEIHPEIVPVLLDASDVGETDENRRAAWLQKLAEETGTVYRRLAPSQGKDWNECLMATKRAQEAARTDADVSAYLSAPDEPEEPSQGVRSGGSKR